jgi:hypothetical protein
MKTIALNPESVRCRLSIVPTSWEKILNEADQKGVKVNYTYKSTPFGTFPLALELSNEPKDK